MNEGYMLLGFLPISIADGEDIAPDAPIDQSAVVADGSIQGNSNPARIPVHE